MRRRGALMSHSNIRDSSSTTDRFKLHPKAWRERLSPNYLISNHRNILMTHFSVRRRS